MRADCIDFVLYFGRFVQKTGYSVTKVLISV